MNVNWDQKLLDLNGKPLADADDSAITLGKAVAMSLSATLEEDRNDTPDAKLKRWHLTQTAWHGGEQEITPEEATMIRTRVCKTSPLMISGQVLDTIK